VPAGDAVLLPAQPGQRRGDAVNAGYDADTVAAMGGTLGGALGGSEALPKRLLGELEYRDELVALPHRLYGLAMYGDSTRLSESMEGGFGRMIPNGELTEGDIPPPGAAWRDIIPFALTFDGYQYWGSLTRCFGVAERHRSAYERDGSIPSSLVDLRTCLFAAQRSWWQSGEWPMEGRELAHVQALVEGIRLAVRLR
jgi:hypothetical protein